IDSTHPETAFETPAFSEPVADWRWPAICGKLLESPAGAAFRGLASLLLETLEERGERTLAVTGSGPAAGRTSLVLTLAQLLSEDPAYRLLLIDLDVERPAVAEHLGIEPQFDLLDTLDGQVPAEHSLIPLLPDRLALFALKSSRAG